MKRSFPTLRTSAGSRAVQPGRWIIFLLLCAVFCFGTRGTGLNTQKVVSFAHAAAATPFTIADFDGDNRPDLATVETALIGVSHARYWIGFRMSAGAPQMIGVTGPVGGLEIASRDVNGDNVIDLVVSAAWLKSPVAVLVNDGHGNFTVHDPSAFSASLTNPTRTLDPPSQSNADTAIAAPARTPNDFAAGNSAGRIIESSEILFSGSSLLNDFSLAVCSSGRAPPLSVRHV